ncbi:hypothetical protein ES702_04501 [subsurface metagenome]
MGVYIFPINQELDLQDTKSKVNARGLTVMKGKDYREGKTKIYNEKDEIIGDSAIFVDPELEFTIDDILDTWSFGNGITKGTILLKDDRKIKCGWMVIDHANINAANGMLTALRNIFKGRPE